MPKQQPLRLSFRTVCAAALCGSSLVLMAGGCSLTGHSGASGHPCNSCGQPGMGPAHVGVGPYAVQPFSGTEWVLKEYQATSERAAELEAERGRLARDNEELQRRITFLEAERTANQVSLAQAQVDVESARGDVQRVSQELNHWRDDMNALYGQLKRSESLQLRDLEAVNKRMNDLGSPRSKPAESTPFNRATSGLSPAPNRLLLRETSSASARQWKSSGSVVR